MLCPYCHKYVNVKQSKCVVCNEYVNTNENHQRYEIVESIRGKKKIKGHICNRCYSKLIKEVN